VEPLGTKKKNKKKPTTTVAWVRVRTISTDRPLLVGEVSANFCGQGVPHGQCDGSLWPYSRFCRPYFLASSSSVVLMRFSGHRSSLRKSGGAGNRTQTSGSVAKNSELIKYYSSINNGAVITTGH
jgi:hypothetical protein